MKLFRDGVVRDNGDAVIRLFEGYGESVNNSKELKLGKDEGLCSIIDTETTGLDHKSDEIIEIAVRLWKYCKKDYKLLEPLEYYAELREPKNRTITKEITSITNIKPEDVKGKDIDWSKVADIILKSDFVLAHNAGFDRPMLEAVDELRDNLKAKIFACSLEHVDWTSRDKLGRKQEILSIQNGFYYTGHRALIDIDALGEIVKIEDCLGEILNNIKSGYFEVKALGAPFNAKDFLKDAKFRWNANDKYWHKTVPSSEIDEIKDLLENKVYPIGKMKASIKKIPANKMFSSLI